MRQAEEAEIDKLMTWTCKYSWGIKTFFFFFLFPSFFFFSFLSFFFFFLILTSAQNFRKGRTTYSGSVLAFDHLTPIQSHSYFLFFPSKADILLVSHCLVLKL